MSQNAEKILQNRSYPDTGEVLFLKRGVIDKETFDCYFRSKDALMDSVTAGVIKEDQDAALKEGMEACPGSGIGGFGFIYRMLTGKEGCNAE